MRKHGLDSWEMVLVQEYSTREECVEAEISAIASARDSGHKLLNLANGGEGGFTIVDKEVWRKKLVKARKGKKPALGMKHSDANRQLFSECSSKYWEEHRVYDANAITQLSFKDAHVKYGISKTHYYRLKRQTNNERL